MPLPETQRITLGERTDPNHTVIARTEAHLTRLGQDAFRLTVMRYLLDPNGKVLG